MNHIITENINQNWSESTSAIAKNSSLSFTLSGWPAAVTLISIPISVVLIYGIKSFAVR